MKQLLFVLSLACTVAVISPGVAVAQCPMCRISAETNLESGGTAGAGLNKGILYLFATPYLIIGGIAYAWYRNRQRTPSEDVAELN